MSLDDGMVPLKCTIVLSKESGGKDERVDYEDDKKEVVPNLG